MGRRRSRAVDAHPLSVRRPRRVALVAIACVAILGLFGLDVAGRLKPISISMPGTPAARGEEQLKRYFGDSAPFAILLRGPAAELDRQGPALVRTLRRDRRVSVLSPWEREASGKLRPAPEKALIMADYHVPIGEAVNDVAPELERTVEARASGSVQATVTGYPMLWRGLKSANETAAERGELIAFPILIVVLLLVFRSPIAAAIPILFGLATLISMRGLIALLSGFVEIDPLTLPVSSMIGLALGIDYALLMVSRFREEVAAGAGPAEAAAITQRTAGRTVVTAGTILFVSLLIALFVVPGKLFAELLGVVILGTAFSVLIAWMVGPAVLTLLGPRLNRWRIGPPIPPRARWMRLVDAALRRPGLVSVLVGVPLLLLALPAIGLSLGASSIEQLPKDSEVRRDAETVSDAVGPGWSAPFVVVASAERGSILDQDRSRAISRWQRSVAADPRVAAVVGPESIIKRLGGLKRFGNGLIGGGKDGPLAGLSGLGPRLDGAAKGVSGLRTGMARAADGAGLLGTGSEQAHEGAGAIADGLQRAAGGGKRAAAGIELLDKGSRRLVEGQRGARLGALQLRLGLETVMPNVARRGLGQATALRDDLRRRAAEDPDLGGDAARAADLVLRLTKARNQIDQLRKQAANLHGGLSKLTNGGERLQQGIGRLSSATSGLEQGLSRLHAGSSRLAEGLGALSGGARTLGQKLSDGFHRSSPLQVGLRRASDKATNESGALEKKLGSIRRFSPGIFDSGYFLVSALDGARPRTKPAIEQTVNLQHGAQAIRILVIPKDPLNSAGAKALYDDLQDRVPELAVDARATVGIAGGNAQLIDYARAAEGRIPLLVLAIFAATLLLLIVFLRALWLSVVAGLLNLATVAVAFGVLALVGKIPAGYPLGGYGAVEVTGGLSVFCVAFGLSIDYAVFLLMRMRESYDRDGDHAKAIALGLEKTARVITGAAAIMTVVFVSFASSQIAIMTQIGVGLAVAVALDATVVRLIFLPAVMVLLGERLWWLPRPLERLLSPRTRPSAVDGQAAAAGN